jgi:hypothetical protein
MRRPFTLIQSTGSKDTARCVAELQQSVAEKRLLGLAYVALYAGRNYELHACGEADRSPTFTAGAVGILKRQLEDKVLGAT